MSFQVFAFLVSDWSCGLTQKRTPWPAKLSLKNANLQIFGEIDLSNNSISHVAWLASCPLNSFSTAMVCLYAVGRNNPLGGNKFGVSCGIVLLATCAWFGSPLLATDLEASPSGCLVLLAERWGLTLAPSLVAGHC